MKIDLTKKNILTKGIKIASDVVGRNASRQHRLMRNPGVVCETLTCFYASAAVNWFYSKVNQFTAARTPCETRAAQSRQRWAQYDTLKL
jgi:hypothetical protein